MSGPLGERDSARALMLASVGIAATFIATTAIVQYRASRIDAAADEIANNSSPSIEHLAAVRGDIRDVQFRLDDYVDNIAAGQVGDRPSVEAAVKSIDAEISAYVQLDTYAD